MPIFPPAPVGPFFQTLTGTAGDDQLRGSNFNDLILGADGNDALSGLRGNDYIDGGAGDDIVAGGAGNDTLIGGTGNDTINSGTGNDLIFGGDGNDSITAQLNDTTLVSIYGGSGQDLFELVNASAGFQAQIGDFSFAEDTLTINGQALSSLVAGGIGITALSAGDVSVHLPQLGGTLILTGTSSQSLVSNLNLAGNDTFTGSEAADFFDGEGGADQISGGDGADVLGGGDGDDVIFGGLGDDTMGGDRGNDQLFGGDGNDEIYGRFGFNLIDGGEGDDVLSTGRDSSTVFGGAGDDYISARLEAGGDHVLTGGAGADTFDFFGAKAKRQSDNIITDFDLLEDSFTVNEADGFDYAAANGLTFTQGSTGAVLALPTGSTITFNGVSADQMNAMMLDIELIY